MLCSVVTPTYNRAESLARTLDALAAQTLPAGEFEVVVVSDGSTDGTEALLQEYAARGALPNLVAVAQANAGPAAARNKGIEHARSDIVVFIDDDVEPVADCLERHLLHHADDPRVVVLGPLSPNPRFTAIEPVWIAWEHVKLRDIYDLFTTGPYKGCDAGFEHFYSGNASVRRRWVVDVGGFNPEFKRQEDVELAERLKRQIGVRFVWDFAADGLHHPARTLASWMAIPSAYGRLDAERVLAGRLDRGHVERVRASRHRATRALESICGAAPMLAGPVAQALCRGAALADRARLRGPALAALGAGYNVLYADAYRRRMRDGA